MSSLTAKYSTHTLGVVVEKMESKVAVIGTLLTTYKREKRKKRQVVEDNKLIELAN